jgi:hypothetical protein
MKIISLIAASIMLAASTVSGTIAMGSCPPLTSLPWVSAWDTNNEYYLQYVDTLVDNGYTLFNLIIMGNYTTADCLGMAQTSINNATYVGLLSEGTTGQLPATVAVSWYEASSNTLLLQACADASSVGTYLVSLAASGTSIPSWATTLIQIGTYLLKFVHFQLNAVVSTTRALAPATVTAI